YVTSGLLVVLIWKQFVQASMFLLRPLSTLQIVLMLLISLAEVIAFREIAHFSAWVVGLGLVGIVGGLIRLNNLRVQSVSVFESKKAQNDTTIGIRSGILYLLLGFLFSTGGIIFHIWFAGSATPLASGTEWVVLGTLICLMGILAVHDQRYLIKLVKDATLYSDLQMDRFGGVEYISEHSRRRHSG
ncbi:MAG TPA: hypothetical protein VFS83_20395, partial [Ktedonobacterales bacterium]|nr:hypothetical protein [Ktedonobacterales bacterium]